MKNKHTQPIVALFIDGDNAPAKKIEFIIKELAVYGSVMVKKIYGNWKSDRLNQWSEVLLDYGLVPVQQFDYTKGKNATDMAMAIDVMDLLLKGKIDVFCLVSSDCDFTPLVMRIKLEGKQVIGFGESKTPRALRDACSKFLLLDDVAEKKSSTILMNWLRFRSSNKNERQALQDELVGSMQKKSGVELQNNTTLGNERQVLQDELAGSIRKKSGTDLKGDTTLMNLLRGAIESCCDDEGWAPLNKMGQIIRQSRYSFDSKNYGYAKFGDLIKAIDVFETKYSDNRLQLYVRNKRNKPKI